MTDSKKRNKIKGWIYSILDLTDTKLDLVEHSKGINMSYNFIHNRIGVDISRIQEARKELASPVALKTYIEVMTLHELGHAADREALLESMPWTIEVYNLKKSVPKDSLYSDPNVLKVILDEQLMNIEFEKTAWRHAETMNNLHQVTDDKTFNFIHEHSQASYEEPYKKNLCLYERLLADSIELTA
ncbi:integrase [Metaplanococcus flavidus]|uniref:Integrase n=1 Tax=Metaplanococcus flavidus TaxID=569883 RepID=A0ABW3LCH3_9BACL